MPRLLKKTTSPLPPRHGAFVGRARERQEFRSSVAYVMGIEKPPGGNPYYPHLFLIHGEDGMGKTALLRQFLATATQEGIAEKRILHVDLTNQRMSAPDMLTEHLAQTIQQHYPRNNRHYRQALSRYEELLPQFQALKRQWQHWTTLRNHREQDLEAIVQTHYRTARAPDVQRAGFGKLHEPAHIEIQTAWAMEGLADILGCHRNTGRLPVSFDDLLQCTFGEEASLFQANRGLGRALAEDLYHLAEAAPILLAIDGYEQVAPYDEWLCSTILAHSSDRMLTVLAGRNPPDTAYRQTFSGEYANLIRVYNLNEQPLHADEVRTYLTMRTTPASNDQQEGFFQRSLRQLLPAPTEEEDEEEQPDKEHIVPFQSSSVSYALVKAYTPPDMVEDILSITRGVPLVVVALCDHAVSAETVAPYQGLSPMRRDVRSLVCDISRRFLRVVLENPQETDTTTRERTLRDRQCLRSLAMLLRPDEEMVAAFWDLSQKQASKVALGLDDAYSFAFADNTPYTLHPLVRTCLREDLLTEKQRTTDWPALHDGLYRLMPVLQKRIISLERKLRRGDERYLQAEWREAVLDLLNVFLWLGAEEEARRLLVNHWVSARYANPPFAEELASLARELAPRTPDWQRTIWAMQEDDLALFEPFIPLLELHAHVVLLYLRAQQSNVWLVVDKYDYRRINQHIVLLEQAYALDADWPPVQQALAEAYEHRGRYRYQQKDYTTALEDLSKSLALRPAHAVTLASRATVRHYLADDRGALEDFTHALTLHPDYPTTLTNRGVIHYYLGDYTSALQDYNRSLHLRPDHAITLYNRGVAKHMAGDRAGALQDFDHALLIWPDDPDTLNSRGVVKEHMGDYHAALTDLNHSLALRPDDADTLYNRGVVRERMGDYRGALVDFDRSLALRPYDPATLDNRGVVRVRLGDYEGALKDYDRSLVLRPDHAMTLDNRGVAKAYLGYYDAALKDYEQAMRLNPDDPSPMYNMACLYALRGQANKALQWLEQAIAQGESWRLSAQGDSDFNAIRNDPRFVALVQGG